MNAKNENENSQANSPQSAPAASNGDPVIDSFRGDFGFLSNFYEATIYVGGERYRSIEHAYQAHKTLDLDLRRLIREAKTSGIAKKLGQAVKIRDDWESVKVDLMRDFIRRKFENPFLRLQLLATEGARLVEGNTWGDVFWGVCKGKGQNWLGKILMDERSRIQREEESEGSFPT